MMSGCLRGQGLNERKRVLLEQIWLPGRLMERLFFLSGQSGLMALFEFSFWSVKEVSCCAKLCCVTRQGHLWSVDSLFIRCNPKVDQKWAN